MLLPGCASDGAAVAVMLCRAYEVKVEGSSWGDLSQSAVEQAYRKGWLNETALSAPNIQLCRGALLKSAFAAAKIPVYDSVLYAAACRCPIMKLHSHWEGASALRRGEHCK